nr:MAG TPA: hypothetical protein [Caudoviricetes sp.]DAX05079.1 MAG TPA: hypothetical protein [Caudoviricetes sp.]
MRSATSGIGARIEGAGVSIHALLAECDLHAGGLPQVG